MTKKPFETGYDDGYAEGFNTQCEIRKNSVFMGIGTQLSTAKGIK